MQSPSRHGGFTLIELLITVTIISILAAIAIPAYFHYATRAQVAESLSVVTSAKMAVTEYYLINGVFPGNNAEVGMESPESYQGKYVTRIDILEGGVIQAGLQGQYIAGHTLSLSPAEGDTVTWTCTSTLSKSLLPPACRGDEADEGGD